MNDTLQRKEDFNSNLKKILTKGDIGEENPEERTAEAEARKRESADRSDCIGH